MLIRLNLVVIKIWHLKILPSAYCKPGTVVCKACHNYLISKIREFWKWDGSYVGTWQNDLEGFIVIYNHCDSLHKTKPRVFISKKKKDQVNSKGLLQEQQYWNHKTKKSYKQQMAAQAQQSTALLRKPPNTMQHIVHDSNFTIKNHVV